MDPSAEDQIHSHPPGPGLQASADCPQIPTSHQWAPLEARFFARPAELVAPDLIGCRLIRTLGNGEQRWGVVVETEAYSQAEPACHGHRRRSPQNETLFGEPGRFYVYVSYGMHHCVNVVTERNDWANGVLLRAVLVPGSPERAAAGPALLARHFDLDRRHDALPVAPASGVWLAARPPGLEALLAEESAPGGEPLVQTTRIGIRLGQELPWRWYLRCSRSISRRARGDRQPRIDRLAAVLGSGATARQQS